MSGANCAVKAGTCDPPCIVQSSTVLPAVQPVGYCVTIVSAPGSVLTRSNAGLERSGTVVQPSIDTQSATEVVAPG
jgi:hypothetical protein